MGRRQFRKRKVPELRYQKVVDNLAVTLMRLWGDLRANSLKPLLKPLAHR